MPLFEVGVKTLTTEYYEVEAKTADEAAEKWSRDSFAGSSVESEEVISVTSVFDDGEDREDWKPEDEEDWGDDS